VTVVRPPRPVAKVTAGPTPPAGSRPRFRFTSNAAVATYQCRVDGGAWRGCRSPWTAPRTATGGHRMYVRATDTFKQQSARPASYRFTVG
jgi:hypothetical protein